MSVYYGHNEWLRNWHWNTAALDHAEQPLCVRHAVLIRTDHYALPSIKALPPTLHQCTTLKILPFLSDCEREANRASVSQLDLVLGMSISRHPFERVLLNQNKSKVQMWCFEVAIAFFVPSLRASHFWVSSPSLLHYLGRAGRLLTLTEELPPETQAADHVIYALHANASFQCCSLLIQISKGTFVAIPETSVIL